MQHKANTTYITYQHCRGNRPIVLSIKALVNYRDHHSETRSDDWTMTILERDHGVQVQALQDAIPLYLFADRGDVILHHEWYRRDYRH